MKGSFSMLFFSHQEHISHGIVKVARTVSLLLAGTISLFNTYNSPPTEKS